MDTIQKQNNRKKYVAAGVLAVCFLLWIVCVRMIDVGAVRASGPSVGFSHLNQAFHQIADINMTWYLLSEILGILAILDVVCFVIVGLVQLIRRRGIRKVDREIITYVCVLVIMGALYLLFEKVVVNCRPVLMPGETMPEASFPSSHTMLAIVVFGCTALLLARYLKNTALRRGLQILCTVLAILAVVSRLLCGAHWLTDIIGGILISLALVFFYAALQHPSEP